MIKTMKKGTSNVGSNQKSNQNDKKCLFLLTMLLTVSAQLVFDGTLNSSEHQHRIAHYVPIRK